MSGQRRPGVEISEHVRVLRGRSRAGAGAARSSSVDCETVEVSTYDREQLITALTTEHFTLQAARSQTISETSGRASVYMLSVSSALVALGFVSQSSTGSRTAFVALALTVLPTLYLLGCATYVRIVECSAEDLRYAVAINRIRSYYLEVAGERSDLFLLSAHDDAAGAFAP